MHIPQHLQEMADVDSILFMFLLLGGNLDMLRKEYLGKCRVQ